MVDVRAVRVRHALDAAADRIAELIQRNAFGVRVTFRTTLMIQTNRRFGTIAVGDALETLAEVAVTHQSGSAVEGVHTRLILLAGPVGAMRVGPAMSVRDARNASLPARVASG
jgi:hypothetical protein